MLIGTSLIIESEEGGRGAAKKQLETASCRSHSNRDVEDHSQEWSCTQLGYSGFSSRILPASHYS